MIFLQTITFDSKVVSSSDLPSISSTFYARLFRTKFWCQKTKVLFSLPFWRKKHFRMKNASVKCWWNWHLVEIKLHVYFFFLFPQLIWLIQNEMQDQYNSDWSVAALNNLFCLWSISCLKGTDCVLVFSSVLLSFNHSSLSYLMKIILHTSNIFFPLSNKKNYFTHVNHIVLSQNKTQIKSIWGWCWIHSFCQIFDYFLWSHTV